jgi:hypothetical protein
MHVHGHFFRLMNTAGGTLRPPVKDTILIRPVGQAGSSAVVQMLMDNPGRWVFHCHDMEHMATGMMTSIEYSGDSDGDGVEDRRDLEPGAAIPITTVSDQAAAFRPGASGGVVTQWTSGQAVALLVFPAFGVLHLDPAAIFYLGAAVADVQHRAVVPYSIPPDQNLIGLRLPMQTLATTMLAGGLRLGSMQAMTVR